MESISPTAYLPSSTHESVESFLESLSENAPENGFPISSVPTSPPSSSTSDPHPPNVPWTDYENAMLLINELSLKVQVLADSVAKAKPVPIPISNATTPPSPSIPQKIPSIPPAVPAGIKVIPQITTGIQAFRAMIQSSDTIFSKEGVAYETLMQSALFSETDPTLAKHGSALAYLDILTKDQFFRSVSSKFETEINTVNRKPGEYRSSMDTMMSALSTRLSAESSVKILFEIMTRKYRLTEHIPSSSPSLSRMVLNCSHAYAVTSDNELEKLFSDLRNRVIKPSTLLIDPSTPLPGFDRLNHPDPTIRIQNWTAYLVAVLSYLFKEQTTITRSSELSLYFPSISKPDSHPLAQTVETDGTLESYSEWFNRESSAFTRLCEASRILKQPQIIPDDFSRIQNSMLALHPLYLESIYECIKFKPQWNATRFVKETKDSTQRIPDIDFDQFSSLCSSAYDLFLLPPRFGKVPIPHSNHNSRKQKQTASSSSDSCRRCKSNSHKIETCPQPAIPCLHFAKWGKCKYEDKCIHLHSSDNKVIPAKVNNSPAAPPASLPISSPSSTSANKSSLKDPHEVTKAVPPLMINIKCRECSLEFSTDQNWWENLKMSLPKSCTACRQKKKAPVSNITEAPVSDNESDAEDDFNSYATCMMVLNQPGLMDSDGNSTDDDIPGLPFARRKPVFRASNFLLEESIESEDNQCDDQIEFEQRMLKRFNPNHEVTALLKTRTSLAPRDQKRVSVQPDRYRDEDDSILLEDIPSDELSAALFDSDLDHNVSIDLDTDIEQSEHDQPKMVQQTLDQFWNSVPNHNSFQILDSDVIATGPLSPHSFCGIPMSTNHEDNNPCYCFSKTMGYCTRCMQCSFCCNCQYQMTLPVIIDEREFDDDETERNFRSGPARP